MGFWVRLVGIGHTLFGLKSVILVYVLNMGFAISRSFLLSAQVRPQQLARELPMRNLLKARAFISNTQVLNDI